jgi:hypothetical protein
MANDVFDISTDVAVVVYTYDPNVMVWSASRWDQDNWASGSETKSWQQVTGDVVSIQTNNGFDVLAGYARPITPTATIVMQGAQYDPAMNSLMRPGTPIRIQVRPNPDTAPGVWKTLWQGRISDCDVSYSIDWLNTITFQCDHPIRDVLNYVSVTGISVPNPCYSTDFWTVMNAATGVNIIQSGAPGLVGYDVQGFTTSGNVEYGTLVNNLSDTNLGALAYQPNLSDTDLYYYTWFELRNRTTAPDVVFEAVASATANRADFSDILIGFETLQYVNTLNYTTAGGVDDYSQNDDSIAIVGDLRGTVYTRHYYAADADAAANIVTATIPTQLVRQITAPVILRAGQVNEFLLRDPLDTVRVTVANSKVEIDDVFFIRGANHFITVDSWDVTFDLWKGR